MSKVTNWNKIPYSIRHVSLGTKTKSCVLFTKRKGDSFTNPVTFCTCVSRGNCSLITVGLSMEIIHLKQMDGCEWINFTIRSVRISFNYGCSVYKTM